jgi:hypothetical protein
LEQGSSDVGGRHPYERAVQGGETPDPCCIRTTRGFGRLDNVYNAIRSHAPTATVIVLGYPRLFMGVDCNAGTFFSSSEMTKLNATADLLASVESARAAAHGFIFKDAIPPFVGHAVCSSSEWLNGLSNPTSESHHPNRAGQASGYTPLVRSVTG